MGFTKALREYGQRRKLWRGAPHTAKISYIKCVHGVPPAPVYKGAREGGGRPRRRARQGGSPTPTRSRTPPSLVGVGEKERGGEEQGKVGCTPCPLFPYGPIRPIYSPANSCNSPILRKIPESLGTLPVSEYSRPIYQSLCLDHFETPRHVRDHIQDSKQTSVHQNL